MMDSQENALNQGLEDAKQPEMTVEQTANDAETTTDDAKKTAATVIDNQQLRAENTLTKKIYNSKKEIVERLKEIANSEDTPEKAEIDYLKTSFYRIHTAERDAQQKAYIEAGGDPDKYQVLPDEEEEEFRAEMTIIKEKRQKAFLEQEELKQENLKKKESISDRIKAMATTP